MVILLNFWTTPEAGASRRLLEFRKSGRPIRIRGSWCSPSGGDVTGHLQNWINTHGAHPSGAFGPRWFCLALFEELYVPHKRIIDGEMILQYTVSGFRRASRRRHDRAAAGRAAPDQPHPAEGHGRQSESVSDELLDHDELHADPDQLLLHWNLDGGSTFTDVVLTPLGGDDYTAQIPPNATARRSTTTCPPPTPGGNASTHPSYAPAELHIFHVGPTRRYP